MSVGRIGIIRWALEPEQRTLEIMCPCGVSYVLVLPHCVESPCESAVSREESFKRRVTEFVDDHIPRCDIHGRDESDGPFTE